MQPLLKRSKELTEAIERAYVQLAIDAQLHEQQALEQELSEPSVWNNPQLAQAKSKRLAASKAITDPWITLKAQASDIAELMALGDESMLPEFEEQMAAMETEFAALKKQLLFKGPYDDHNAIVRITAGAGGTDAQDWAQMLERMYLRWAEKNSMTTSIIERSAGEEAGVKTSVIEITGPYAYGKLQGEHGVHRLVRLSPFNADNLRQTSFALVEVLPQIETPDEVQLDDKNLKIDVFRAGGHGGQSVNTTDSAVRVTHLPTGITISIQNERSQLQNKETALKMLRSKLAQLQIEQHQETLQDLKGPSKSAEWGSQIRNYVLHPYTLVKDTRTGFEVRDAQKVLDGGINEFIDSFLDAKAEAATNR
ncbi:MAG TPA: peptide chain release factor 2 [Verrucomicrobiae bacterium]|nr:peptide chain release factor 2 [Verrucomicrobiae bacterium]